jgi:chromate reductase, NAD(P)H dehydrogenase (quinone)
MKTPRLLAFSGSLRAESWNQKLVTLAAAAARQSGAEVRLISLRDFRLPLFDEDLEAAEGMPENAKKLKQLFSSHDGFLIASPEYNSSLTAALKNAIDWVSRATEPAEKPLSAFSDKTAAILAVSPGGYGGSRGLIHLRSVLENISVHVLPEQVTIPKAHEAFDAAGNLLDPAQAAAVHQLGESLAVALRDSA